MTKTEAELVGRALSENLVVTDMEKRTAKRMYEQIPTFYLLRKGDGLLRCKFDTMIYMGQLPEGYLTDSEVEAL